MMIYEFVENWLFVILSNIFFWSPNEVFICTEKTLNQTFPKQQKMKWNEKYLN